VKRFLAFAFDQYYPSGGLSDVHGEYDTLKEAVQAVESLPRDYWQVLDMQTGEVADNGLESLLGDPAVRQLLDDIGKERSDG
jgi:hypothetical protein